MYARVEDSGGGGSFTPRKVTKGQHWSASPKLESLSRWFFGGRSLVHVSNYALKDPGFALRIRDFPYNPIVGMGCFDHQSYDVSGGVWILRDG